MDADNKAAAKKAQAEAERQGHRVAANIWQGIADGLLHGRCPRDLALKALDVLQLYVERGLSSSEVRAAWMASSVAAEVREVAQDDWWRRRLARELV